MMNSMLLLPLDSLSPNGADSWSLSDMTSVEGIPSKDKQ